MSRRTFLVTGASKGIGRARSTRPADAGHHVVGIARGSDSDFPGTLVSVDMSESESFADALSELTRKYAFDGVVNNVGLARMHRVGEIDLEDVGGLRRSRRAAG